MSSTVDVIIEVFASNPPSILFALGFVLLLLGFSTGDQGIVDAGWIFVGIGVVLQTLWLILKYR